MVLKPDPVGLEIQHQPLSRDALHEISTEFLASDKLAHAPLAEKKDFLKIKGLSEDEIESLLQRAVAKGKGKEVVAVDSEEASASRISTPASCDAETTTEERVENNEEKGLVPKELKEIRPSPPPSPRLKPTPIEPTHLQQPLIVTYPEFLAPPPQPPAPITAKSLLSTLYYSAAAASTIYAGSKYILQPMYDQLTEARAELAKTALTNLTQFNDKLSALVPSHVRPAIPSPHVTSTGAGGTEEEEALIADESDDERDDASSTSSLRTHLFHVDASTQTMPDPLSNPPPPPTSEEKMSTITSHLTTLIDSNSDGADGELQYELEALTAYLETLRVDPKDLFPWSGINNGAVGADGKEDLTMTVKREIRSVKGVLLNSKNFPGAR